MTEIKKSDLHKYLGKSITIIKTDGTSTFGKLLITGENTPSDFSEGIINTIGLVKNDGNEEQIHCGMIDKYFLD